MAMFYSYVRKPEGKLLANIVGINMKIHWESVESL